MRQPSTLTIIATIREGQIENLKEYLKKEIDVEENGNDNTIKFSELGALHLCSFFIISEEKVLGKPAYLVFEATIDGDNRTFLEELLDSAPKSMAHIYEHCEGCPDSSDKLNRLFVDFLMLRLVSHAAHHCAYPGRTVAQIKSEQLLRSKVLEDLAKLNDKNEKTIPTAAEIHRKIKGTLSNEPNLSWAMQKANLPRVVAHRAYYGALLLSALFSLPVLLVLFIAFQFFGWSPSGLYQTLHTCFKGSIGSTPCHLHLNTMDGLLYLLVVSIAFWIIAIVVKGFVAKIRSESPKSFANQIAVIAVALFSGLSLVMILVSALLLLFKTFTSFGLFTLATGYLTFIGSIFLLAIVTVIVGFFKTKYTGMRDAQNILARQKLQRSWLPFFANVLSAIYYFSIYGLLLITLTFSVKILALLASSIQSLFIAAMGLFGANLNSVPVSELLASVPQFLKYIVTNLIYLFLTALPYLLSAAGVLALLALILLVTAEILGRSEANKFLDAQTLVGRKWKNRNAVFSREEHGYHTNQNHLVSVVHVKKGLLRRYILRFVFWVVNIAAYFIYNRGSLAGIPTILSARWLLIDNGRRVIFMTNYVGAWDSYINEFSDLEGVRGVNAIWSNTMLPDPDNPTDKKPINFPLSSFLLWQGAEKAHQFKSYIRASQVETLVWYSAYPDLGISNINNNTDLRNSLFEKLSTAQLEELAARL